MKKARKKKSVIAELLAGCETHCQRESLREAIRELREAGEDVEEIARRGPLDLAIPGLG